mmetsp:Transcript_65426/g.156436  ORF Transcript_65426/g.156436 Transcript_65426/m.156436 type:complete len:205 (+) Transcript_65426:1384-1998(+)
MRVSASWRFSTASSSSESFSVFSEAFSRRSRRTSSSSCCSCFSSVESARENPTMFSSSASSALPSASQNCCFSLWKISSWHTMVLRPLSSPESVPTGRNSTLGRAPAVPSGPVGAGEEALAMCVSNSERSPSMTCVPGWPPAVPTGAAALASARNCVISFRRSWTCLSASERPSVAILRSSCNRMMCLWSSSLVALKLSFCLSS